MKTYFIMAAMMVMFLFQVTMADVFNQLQFMKIISPTSGQSITAGEKITIKYAMQPLVYKDVSNGYAKSLKINFHKRSGNTKQQHLETVRESCPITASQDKFKTYSTTWTVPKNTQPGSYAIDFMEVAQLRRGELTSSETVKVNIVD